MRQVSFNQSQVRAPQALAPSWNSILTQRIQLMPVTGEQVYMGKPRFIPHLDD